MSTTATSLVPSPSQGPTTPKPIHVQTPTSTPGKFRHPLTTEILRRNAASSLTDAHVKSAVTNIVALLLSFIFSDLYYSTVTTIVVKTGIASGPQIPSISLLLIRLLFCINIVVLLRPVLPYAPKKDEINDIPLTPSQRHLLGLPPSRQSTPTVGSATAAAPSYVTPPRYRRLSSSKFSSGSDSPSGAAGTIDRRSISANYSSSPLSTSRYTLGFSPTPSKSTIAARRTASGSPFSPSPTGSPLFHKAVTNNSSSSQAQIPATELDFSASSTFSSFGLSATSAAGSSTLGRSQSMRERQRPSRESLDPQQQPNSPSPTRVVPGLNYKWLYDKGRKLPRSESSYGF